MTDYPIVPAPLPEGAPKFLRVVRARLGVDVSFVSFSSRVCGILTHWADDASIPHQSNAAECPGCQRNQPIRWKGYLYGHSYTHRCPALLELPADTVRHTVCLRDSDVTLRGATILLRRIGPNRNSPVVARVRTGAERVGPDTPDPDVLALLCRVFLVILPPRERQPRTLPGQVEGPADANQS